MIDSFSTDATGWARFSDEKLVEPIMRYRLARACSVNGQLAIAAQKSAAWPTSHSIDRTGRFGDLIRVVFLMLNPSTADAFELDPTVRECIRFARLWVSDLDIVEVVNLFAFRTPYPAVLKRASARCNDTPNNEQIMQACTGAKLVIAAWGTGGALDNRDVEVRLMLARAGIATHHLGRTKDGHPKHPLARGKHRIPADQQPIPCMVASAS